MCEPYRRRRYTALQRFFAVLRRPDQHFRKAPSRRVPHTDPHFEGVSRGLERNVGRLTACFAGSPHLRVTDETGSCPEAGRPTSGLAHPDWPRTPRGRRRAHDHSHPAPTASPKTRAPWGKGPRPTPTVPLGGCGPQPAFSVASLETAKCRCSPRARERKERPGSRLGLGVEASAPRRSPSPVYPQSIHRIRFP